MINLLKNATKFTFKGFIALSVSRAKLLVTQNNKPIGHEDAIVFDVFDTGIGISPDGMANMFTLFGKLMQSDSEVNKEGIGLGLYIVKRMVTQLGGTINVASKQNEFTRFTMTLPVRQTFLRLATEEEVIDTTRELRDSRFELSQMPDAQVLAMSERLFQRASSQPFFCLEDFAHELAIGGSI